MEKTIASHCLGWSHVAYRKCARLKALRAVYRVKQKWRTLHYTLRLGEYLPIYSN